jgi:hypothetical protein
MIPSNAMTSYRPKLQNMGQQQKGHTCDLVIFLIAMFNNGSKFLVFPIFSEKKVL